MSDTALPRESNIRSLAKAITYRITGSLTTAAITWFVTGDLHTALAVGGLEPIVKIGVYYAHERIWQRIPVGTVRRLFARLTGRGDSGTRS